MDRSKAALIAGAAVAGAAAIGPLFGPRRGTPKTDAWYVSLEKPSYTPPGPVIGGVWAVMYGLLGYAGYRLLSAPPQPARSAERSRAIALWGFNVAAIPGWTALFFGARSLSGSLGLVATMLGSGVAYVVQALRVDQTAALAGAPYAAWVAFAGLLNEEIWRRNRGRGYAGRLARRVLPRR